MKLAVVGGGVVGLAVAAEIQRRSLAHVTLFDPEIGDDAPTASSAAGAMLGAFGEVEGDGREEEADVDYRYVAATRHSQWREWIEHESRTTIHSTAGTFIFASSRAKRDRSNMQAIRAALQSRNVDFEEPELSRCEYLRPAQDHPLDDLIFVPSEFSLDAPQLVRALRAVVDRSGVQITRKEVTAVSKSRGEGCVVAAGAERSEFDHVVLCAGAFAHELLDLELRELIPPIYAGKGTAVLLEHDQRLQYAIRSPNREFACGIHLVPRLNHTYLGATNRVASLAGVAGGATAGEAHYLIDRALHEINPAIGRLAVNHLRHGNRPLTADGRPLVGRTEWPALSVATATHRNGVLLAPLIASDISDGLANDKVASQYSPIGRVKSLEDRIARAREVLGSAVEDLAELMLEPGGQMPYGRADLLKRQLAQLLPLLFDSEAHSSLVTELVKFPSPALVPEVLLLLGNTA